MSSPGTGRQPGGPLRAAGSSVVARLTSRCAACLRGQRKATHEGLGLPDHRYGSPPILDKIDVALHRDSGAIETVAHCAFTPVEVADPFSVIEACMVPVLGQIKVRAGRGRRNIAGSPGWGDRRQRAPVRTVRPLATRPGGLTRMERTPATGPEWARVPQSPTLTKESGIARFDRTWGRSLVNHNSPLERNPIAGSSGHASSGRCQGA